MHRQSNPRSPVQNVKDRSWLPVVGVLLGTLITIGWQQSALIIDWYDGELTPSASGPRQATANLVQLFSTDDYPVEAIRREEQGTAAFQLSISRRGYVSECRIVSSSGSDALDQATCDILKRRARFDPARNAQGERVADHYSGRIRRELPDE